jgi:nitrogen fixation protein FixH
MLDIDPETARRNMILGWALFGVFVLLFGGTVVVALIYLWVAG